MARKNKNVDAPRLSRDRRGMAPAKPKPKATRAAARTPRGTKTPAEAKPDDAEAPASRVSRVRSTARGGRGR